MTASAILSPVKSGKSTKASLGDVAKAVGMSKATVSYALRNYPSISLETRQRIQRIAQQVGYSPDARMASWMAKLQKTRSKELLPIAWLNTDEKGEDVWRRHKFLSPYLEGARERCLLLGYRIEEFWALEPGMTIHRLSDILYHRGIQGVIVTYPARHLRLRWEHLAGVGLGGSLLAPRIHQVAPDLNFNLTLTHKLLRRYGYRRIGICASDWTDRFSHRMFRSLAHQLFASVPPADRIPPLFYPGEHGANAAIAFKLLKTWVQRYQPEVIICSSNLIQSWLLDLNLRVPEDVGLVHLSLDDDVLDWAGIHSNKKEIGATAAEWVISMVQNHRFGVPAASLTTLVRGSWQHGKTLRIPQTGTRGLASPPKARVVPG